MDSADRRNVQFKLAQHYGRKCRVVFPHGDWTQHEACIASGWSYMARELPWEQARDAVHDGWEKVDFDGRSLLFSATNDNADDDAADDSRAFQ